MKTFVQYSRKPSSQCNQRDSFGLLSFYNQKSLEMPLNQTLFCSYFQTFKHHAVVTIFFPSLCSLFKERNFLKRGCVKKQNLHLSPFLAEDLNGWSTYVSNLPITIINPLSYKCSLLQQLISVSLIEKQDMGQKICLIIICAKMDKGKYIILDVL